MLPFQLHSSVLLTPRAPLLKAMTQTRLKGIICNCSMLTPESRAFKWYTSLLPSCRHILVSQILSSDPRIEFSEYVCNFSYLCFTTYCIYKKLNLFLYNYKDCICSKSEFLKQNRHFFFKWKTVVYTQNSTDRKYLTTRAGIEKISPVWMGEFESELPKWKCGQSDWFT